MRAIFIAAGMGVRLRPLSNSIPKGLIVVGPETLFERSINMLIKNGIKDVVIVIGHLGELIKQKLGDDYNGAKITYLDNKEYATTHTLHSFLKSRDYLDDDIILLESDLLYQENLIKIVLESRYDNLFVVTNHGGSGDEYFTVVDKDNKIKKTSPDRELENISVGEFIGVSKLSKHFLNSYLAKMDKIMFNPQKTGYENSLLDIKSDPVYPLIINQLKWTEIDNLEDLQKAKRIFEENNF